MLTYKYKDVSRIINEECGTLPEHIALRVTKVMQLNESFNPSNLEQLPQIARTLHQETLILSDDFRTLRVPYKDRVASQLKGILINIEGNRYYKESLKGANSDA